jgi:hypothetical protein
VTFRARPDDSLSWLAILRPADQVDHQSRFRTGSPALLPGQTIVGPGNSAGVGAARG